MLTAAFLQSFHCELTVVNVLLTTLSFVPDNRVTTLLLLPFVTDSLRGNAVSLTYRYYLNNLHLSQVCVRACLPACLPERTLYEIDAR